MESCVETSAAPEWLSKLESRREKLTSSKLGHEVGAGAPCNDCGDKCPGLDLHFWRKVCRNCKCRKDQHDVDDDLSGWAQFEILGQIRSKPAYIKIKAFADNPVQVDWVPPNITPELASDYMDNLGSMYIPVVGSDAAAKRKQQLEFQVPPHDLDAALCDSLTETEAAQMKLYVDNIKNHCVGQGSVIRIDSVPHGVAGKVGSNTTGKQAHASKYPPRELLTALNSYIPEILRDRVAMSILNSENLGNIILSNTMHLLPQKLCAFDQPLVPDFDNTNLSPENKKRLVIMRIDKDLAHSLIENGPFYDNLLRKLSEKKANFSEDPILEPIKNFRVEYLNNKQFKNDMNRFALDLGKIDPQYATPVKSKTINSDAFLSPLPVRNPVQTKVGALMKQDTPMRRVKFGGISVALDLGLPIDALVERDHVFSSIIHSDQLQSVLQNYSKIPYKNKIVVLNTPMTPDFEDISGLSLPTRSRLEKMRLNTETVYSGVVNGPLYDKLFDSLRERGINFANCHLLNPISQLRQEALLDVPLQQELDNIIRKNPERMCDTGSVSQDVSPVHQLSFRSNPQSPFKSGLHCSKSTDSGFESKPPTPNYSTFPGVIPTNNQNEKPLLFGLNAHSETLSPIPGIEDFNMYPQVAPGNLTATKNMNEGIEDHFDRLRLSTALEGHCPVPVLKCKECAQDIMSGEVAVKAERAGKDTAWHPQCFVCKKCGELLADLVYFFHNGCLYCGRDLAIILEIPRCHACDELIFTKEYTAAEGSTFHIKHFCCYHCDIPLAGQEYVPDEKSNMPVCLKCYDEFYAASCQKCKKVIGPTEEGVVWGKNHWHHQCFTCAGLDCGKSLLGGRLCVKNNSPFCSSRCVSSIVN